MSDQRELYRLHTEGQSQYVYFLLASTGAALGYAAQQLDGILLSWWSSPALLSLLLWLASFYCGCKRITLSHRLLSANCTFLQLQNGTHPNPPGHPLLNQAALYGVKSAVDEIISKLRKYLVFQFALLTLGVTSFIAWRIIDMWRLTHGT